MKKLWGGRFTGALDEGFAAFNRSLPVDRRLVREDVRGSVAWARELGRAGVLSADEARRLEEGLADVLAAVEADPALLERSDAEDVHAFVESQLAGRVGALAGKLHTGRSRNDQVATDLALWLRDAARDLCDAAGELARALLDLAARHADAPLPGYTHLQRAQPVTIGHHCLAYVEMLARDRGRFEDAARRADRCPLGSGALAGTAFPVDRERLAAELGFAGPTRNSLDAASDRDGALELAGACALAMTHLSRLAEDWIFFASSEAGFLALSDAVATGSSLMPQKKNPDALELVRGKAGRVIGRLAGLLATVKGLPLAYDKDLQEDKEALFDAVDTTRACLRVTALVARNATFDRARCAAEAERGYLNATDLADLLVAAGVPFREAHERTGAAVRQALELGVELADLPGALRRELLPELAHLADDAWRAALSADAVLRRRGAIGGTSPARVRAELERWERSGHWSEAAAGRRENA